MNTVKQKFNNFIQEAKMEAYTTAVKISAGDASAFSKSDRAVAGVAGGASAVLYSALAVHADVIDTVKSMLENYYDRLFLIASALATFCILIALLWAMVSPSPQGAQTPISWIKKILITYFLVISIPGIISLVGSMAGGK